MEQNRINNRVCPICGPGAICQYNAYLHKQKPYKLFSQDSLMEIDRIALQEADGWGIYHNKVHEDKGKLIKSGPVKSSKLL